MTFPNANRDLENNKYYSKFDNWRRRILNTQVLLIDVDALFTAYAFCFRMGYSLGTSQVHQIEMRNLHRSMFYVIFRRLYRLKNNLQRNNPSHTNSTTYQSKDCVRATRPLIHVGTSYLSDFTAFFHEREDLSLTCDNFFFRIYKRIATIIFTDFQVLPIFVQKVVNLFVIYFEIGTTENNHKLKLIESNWCL